MEPIITEEQAQKIEELWHKIANARVNHKRKPGMSIDDFFDIAPEGDFVWDDDVADSWHVYNCGDEDCPVGWHLISYVMTMGRKNGKRWVEIHDVDSDGNWDFSDGYDERENDAMVQWDDLAETIANLSDDFFLGWAEYWIDAAETGKDVCGQMTRTIPPDKWVELCIQSAEDNLKYFDNN